MQPPLGPLQVPKNNTKDTKDMLDIEQEKKEALKARYDRLLEEALEIKRYGDITFELSTIQPQGLQTLIVEYGSDLVFRQTYSCC